MVARSAKSSLRVGDQVGHVLGARLATILLAAYMESRVNEVIWYYSGVPEVEKVRLVRLSVENKWRQLVRLGFARKCSLSPSQVPDLLPFTDRARHEKILAIIDSRIVELAQARNALAHGQWNYAFRDDGHTIDPARMKVINQYSLWRVTLERNLLKHLVQVVHDLTVSTYAYERDFDKHIKNLESADGRITKGNRHKWERTLIMRYRRRPTTVDQ